jgi:hypothetical protein
MGGTLTLDPDNTYPSLTFGWVAVGGPDLDGAVADGLDTTYVTDSTPGAANTRISWSLSTAALPAGSAINYSYPVIRNSQPTGNRQLTMSMGTYYPPDGISYQSPGKVWTPTASIVDTSGAAAGAVPQSRSQGVVDLLFISVLQYPSSAFAEDHRIYKVQGKVVYVSAPTPASPALYPPSANTLTTRPGLQWGLNSPDSLAQYEYRAALWKLSDVTAYAGGRAAFEAAVETVFSPAGYTGHAPKWTSGGWVKSSANNVTPDVDLDGTSQYVWYVQTSALWANERLAHPTTMGILDFTQAITIPAVPTSVTPTWLGAGSWAGSVSVPYPAQALGSWTGRQLILQAKDAGAVDESAWRTLPGGVREIGAGSGTAVFNDPYVYSGQSKTYRAKTLLYKNPEGYSSGSAWVTSANITGSYSVFVLRDPNDNLSTTEFRILGDLEAQHDEVQGSFRPLGSEFPVVISDSITGRRWSLEVLVKTKLQGIMLENLREARTPLVLHTDMAFLWYWVRFGPSVSKRTIRQPGRASDNPGRTEIWRVELIEVAAPAGQPNGGT